MSKRDELAEKYAKNLDEKVQIKVDQKKMLGIIKACGPSIYNADAETVSSSDPEEMDRVKNGFMKKHLELEGDAADTALSNAIDRYGRSNTHKYRACLYYMLADEAGKLDKFG